MSAMTCCVGLDSLALAVGAGLVSCHFSPTHSPNPSLAPPGERGGLHVAASLKVGNLRATARWPQSGGNPATSRCSQIRRCQSLPQRQVARVLPTFRSKAKYGCWLPFPPRRGWKGAGGIGGGIQRIKNMNAADKHFGSSTSKPHCGKKILQKQELTMHTGRGLEAINPQSMMATAQFTAASRERTR